MSCDPWDDFHRFLEADTRARRLDLATDVRRLEEQNARARRYIVKLFDDRRKARAEIARLHTQFTALAEEFERWSARELAHDEGTAQNVAENAAARIRRILRKEHRCH